MRFPPAYFITWGAYGARPPGCDRPYVDRDHNQYGEPLAPTLPERERWARDHMTGNPVELTLGQRGEAERVLSDFCALYGWTIHAMANQSDHIHIVVTAERDGDPLREALKAAVSRFFNVKYGKRKWWAENGSSRWLWEPEYFANSVAYVKGQQDF